MKMKRKNYVRNVRCFWVRANVKSSKQKQKKNGKTNDSVRRDDDEFNKYPKRKKENQNQKGIPAHNGNEYYNLNGLIHFISVPAVKESKRQATKLASPHPGARKQKHFQLNCRHYSRW